MSFVRIGDQVLDTKHSPAPADRTFREAWRADGSVPKRILVDMEVAKEIARDMIREARKPFFEKYDAAFNRALEDGSAEDKTLVAEKRRRLRNATKDPRIEKAETPDHLKAIISEIVSEF
jgi:hypothetical protein